MQVDICIPTYGTARYLKRTLDSLPITDPNVKVYVADGGSSYDSATAGSVNWDHLHPDPGLVACWQHAVNSGSSPYIAFLADDNIWLPETLERIRHFIARFPDADLWFGRQAFIDEEDQAIPGMDEKFDQQFGRSKLMAGYLSENDRYLAIAHSSIPMEACVMTRKLWESLGGFREETFGALDMHLMSKAILSEAKIAYDDRHWMRFRLHDSAYSSRARIEQIKGRRWALKEMLGSATGPMKKLLTEKYCSTSLDLLGAQRKKIPVWIDAAATFASHPISFVNALRSRK